MAIFMQINAYGCISIDYYYCENLLERINVMGIQSWWSRGLNSRSLTLRPRPRPQALGLMYYSHFESYISGFFLFSTYHDHVHANKYLRVHIYRLLLLWKFNENLLERINVKGIWSWWSRGAVLPSSLARPRASLPLLSSLSQAFLLNIMTMFKQISTYGCISILQGNTGPGTLSDTRFQRSASYQIW